MRGDYLQDKAERCRLMMALATNAEVKEQLRLWSDEFEDIAAAAERRRARRQRLRGAWGGLRRLRAVSV